MVFYFLISFFFFPDKKLYINAREYWDAKRACAFGKHFEGNNRAIKSCAQFVNDLMYRADLRKVNYYESVTAEVFISGKSRRVHPFLFLSNFICINSSFLSYNHVFLRWTEPNILYVFSTKYVCVYIRNTWHWKLNKARRKFFGRRTRECRDIIVFPKRRTRIIITKRDVEKEDNKNIILCFLLFNAKQVIHVPAVAFVPRRAHTGTFLIIIPLVLLQTRRLRV